MTSNNLLLQTAEILEKTAAYLEQTESQRVSDENSRRMKEASDLAGRISDATGEPLDDETTSKLAGLTPEVQGLISRLAGAGAAESMGGPEELAKVASHRGTGSAEASFLNFLMS